MTKIYDIINQVFFFYRKATKIPLLALKQQLDSYLIQNVQKTYLKVIQFDSVLGIAINCV